MKQRYYVLDSLKGLAVIFVMITHFAWNDTVRRNLFFPFWIGMAVPIFMFVSGFVNAAAMDRHGITTFSEAYEVRSIIKKLLRFLVPFLIIAAIELFTNKTLEFENIFDFAAFIFKGAKGPGGYYVTLVLQFVFVFPAIYFIIKSNPRKGLLIAFAFNFLYEFFCAINHMSNSSYSQLIFRFTFIIAFGAFLYFNNKKVNALWYIAAFVIGTAYLIGITYFNFESEIITNKNWNHVSLYAVLYIIPILALLMKFCGNVRIPPLEWIGKRTYSIFLVQMLIYSVTDSPLEQFIKNPLLQNAVIIAICISVGALFDFVVTRISESVGKLIS